MKRIIVAAGLVLLLAAMLSCSGDNPLNTSGNLNVYLTDAPIDLDGVTAVYVTIAEMIVFPECTDPDDDCNGIILDLLPAEGADDVTVNLLDYRNGHVILMASEMIDEGTYNRIRMEIADAWLVIDDGDPDTPPIEEDIFVPSGKVDVVVPFVVSAGEEEEIVLDFDAQQSVHLHETGNEKYILRPVINGSHR